MINILGIVVKERQTRVSAAVRSVKMYNLLHYGERGMKYVK